MIYIMIRAIFQLEFNFYHSFHPADKFNCVAQNCVSIETPVVSTEDPVKKHHENIYCRGPNLVDYAISA